jgi:outer membrane protein OmpA-like peptidoglycan-associated protein
VEQLFSQASGGFANGDTTAAFLEPAVMPLPLVPMPLFYGLFFNTFNVLSSLPADRSLILLDCNGDGVDEALVGTTRVEGGADTIPGLMLLENSGSGLLQGMPLTNLFDLPTTSTLEGPAGIAITKNDFNSDNMIDVAVGVSDFDGVPTNYVALCTGDGACGFDCPTSLADPRVHTLTCAPVGDCLLANPSITSGDFNEDGRPDVAIPEITLDTSGSSFAFESGGVRYLFNNDGDLSTWVPLFKLLPVPFDAVLPLVVTSGQFSDTAVQGGIDEVVVTVNNIDLINPDPTPTAILELPALEVFTTDGAGGINDSISLAFSPPNGIFAQGVEAADFDRCGGDDLVAQMIQDTSGPTPPPFSNDVFSSVFLNVNEPPVVTIAPVPPAVVTDTAFTVSTTCADPTLDERTFQWSVVAQPAGATVVFGTPSGSLAGLQDDASTTFAADTPGDYTIQVDCTDFCGLSDEDVDQIQITFTVFVALTQGANLFNCALKPDLDGKGNPMICMFILMIPTTILLYRLGRKRWFIPTLLILLTLGLALPSFALTNSVSVNTFAPTVDDSEYFTVYNSPTMLQRNFHVGFFLDYAHHPYEFGTPGFNRVSGIVDHLLNANIVGSYGVLNWLSVGLVIPVTLYEGMNAPLLGINESNFALGDVQLVLKFRLLDREKHGVGISIVPFASFPTSTNSTDFLGNGSFGGGAKLVIDGRIKDRVSIALNVGGNIRSQFIDVSGQDIDDQFLASLGISVDIIKRTFKWIGEVQTSTVFKNFYSDKRTTPAEARIGFRYTWANNHDINVGGGMGFSNGIGQPDYRIFLGYTYTKRPLAEVAVPPPPMSEINVGDELTLKDKIFFEFDKDVIRDISLPTLDKIAGFLKAHPEITKIKIDGYTCDLGSAKHNLGLSDRRAKAAARYLEGQGIDPSRIGTVQGFGEENPMVPNVDEAHREQNRRVQIYVEAVDQSLATGAVAPAATE